MRFLASFGIAIAICAVAAGWLLRDAGVSANAPSPALLERATGDATPGAARGGYVSVKFRRGTTLPQMASLHRVHGATIEKAHARSGIQRLRFATNANVDAIAAAYARNPIVEEAGIGHAAVATDAPNDTNYAYQWTMHNTTGGLHAEAAWPMSTSGAGVVVAVIDTGAAYENYTGVGGLNMQTFVRAPDLAQTAFVAPYDFFNNDTHANDDNGHGSHVTGTIAQATNNAYGVAGVAHNATIMPLKVLAFDGTGYDDDVAEAIYWAVAHGANVINMSLGFTGTGAPNGSGEYCSEIVGLGAALEYAHAAGVVVVAAAGNDAGIVSCPAAYPTVIAVGATRFDGTSAYYSNSGAALDVAAPGGDDTVDQNGDGFYDGALQETYCYDYITLLFLGTFDAFCNVFYVGTSMASPHVAGVAALLLGADPMLTPGAVRAIIEGTARDRGPAGWDASYGWGAVDAAAALAAVTGGGPTPTATSTPTNTATATATNTPAAPTNTPTATNTPVPPTATSTPTATPAPPSLHVGDIDATRSTKGSTWTARVTVAVHSSSHTAVRGAAVSGAWSGGATGTAGCVTDRRGTCTITSPKMPLSSPNVTFSVTGVVASGYAYAPEVNHDPDGSSTGTSIIVVR